LLLACDLAVPHRVGAGERAHRVFYLWRNVWYFARRNFAGWRRVAFLVRKVAVRGGIDCLGYLAGGRLTLVAAAVAGLRAGLAGEQGPSRCRYAQPQPDGTATRAWAMHADTAVPGRGGGVDGRRDAR
jgi:hypothetical protein